MWYEWYGSSPSRSTLSASDRDIIARTILGEAMNQGDTGMSAVAWTIRNRTTDSRFPDSPTDVALQPQQFSAWNRGAGGNRLVNVRSGPAYDRAAAIADAVWNGEIPDPTNGAIYYGNVPHARKGWGNFLASQGNITQIGAHTFAGRVNQGTDTVATLRRGMGMLSNPDQGVMALQESLNNAGADIAVDGVFGPETQTAVRNYEQANGLHVDQGVAGPQVLASLNQQGTSGSPWGRLAGISLKTLGYTDQNPLLAFQMGAPTAVAQGGEDLTIGGNAPPRGTATLIERTTVPKGPYGAENVVEAAASGDPNRLQTALDNAKMAMWTAMQSGQASYRDVAKQFNDYMTNVAQNAPGAVRAIQSAVNGNQQIASMAAPFRQQLDQAFQSLPASRTVSMPLPVARPAQMVAQATQEQVPERTVKPNYETPNYARIAEYRPNTGKTSSSPSWSQTASNLVNSGSNFLSDAVNGFFGAKALAYNPQPSTTPSSSINETSVVPSPKLRPATYETSNVPTPTLRPAYTSSDNVPSPTLRPAYTSPDNSSLALKSVSDNVPSPRLRPTTDVSSVRPSAAAAAPAAANAPLSLAAFNERFGNTAKPAQVTDYERLTGTRPPTASDFMKSLMMSKPAPTLMIGDVQPKTPVEIKQGAPTVENARRRATQAAESSGRSSSGNSGVARDQGFYGSYAVSPSGTIMSPSEYVDAMNSGTAWKRGGRLRPYRRLGQ